MDTIEIKENWNDQKSKLMAKFPTLVDTDVHYDVGKEREMFRMIEYKLRKTKREMLYIMKNL